MLKHIGFTFERDADFQKLRKKVIDIRGQPAVQWFENLPGLLELYKEQWELELLEPVKDLSYNLVYHAKEIQTKNDVVFKIGIPGPDVTNEIDTLEHFAGFGCIEIFKANHNDGAMLLEYANPGTRLSTLTFEGKDAEAVHICADVIKMLRDKSAATATLKQNLRNLTDRVTEYAEVRDANIDFDRGLLQQGADLVKDLCASTTETAVLHGDLHHDNILSAQRHPWLAIDPHGIIGDPTFEVAPFMCNPIPKVTTLPDLKQLLLKRVNLFHELLGYDKSRIIGWSAAHAILVAAQHITDHGPEGAEWQEWVTVGKHLLDI